MSGIPSIGDEQQQQKIREKKAQSYFIFDFLFLFLLVFFLFFNTSNLHFFSIFPKVKNTQVGELKNRNRFVLVKKDKKRKFFRHFRDGMKWILYFYIKIFFSFLQCYISCSIINRLILFFIIKLDFFLWNKFCHHKKRLSLIHTRTLGLFCFLLILLLLLLIKCNY